MDEEWTNPEKIKGLHMKQGEKTAELLREGYFSAWKEMGDGLVTVLIAYFMLVWLPRWLIEPETWTKSSTKLRHGAFLIFKVQVDDDLIAAFNMAALGNYSSANIILRACLEYLCRGAFYDCIAKEEYRRTTNLLKKKSKQDDIGERGSIQRLLNDISIENSGFLNELECQSAAILDKLAVFMQSKRFRGMFPNFKEIVEQLEKWDLFYPINLATSYIYDGGYHFLSLATHGSVDHIDSGRRLLDEKPLFALPTFESQQFVEFISNLYQVIDLGLVLTFNIMSKQASGTEFTVSFVKSHPMFEQLPIKSFKHLVNELNKNSS
jgi:hypothetical protein